MISDEVNVYKGNWLHKVNHEIGATSMLELINFKLFCPFGSLNQYLDQLYVCTLLI